MMKLLYFTSDSPSMPEEVPKHLKKSLTVNMVDDDSIISETDGESILAVALLFKG